MIEPESIRQYLQYLLDLLSPTGALAERRLGFQSQPPRSKSANYIFVQVQEGGPGLWYYLEDGPTKDKPVQIYLDSVAQSHLVGNLQEVTMVEVPTEKYGLALKIDLIFDVGEAMPTIIRSGPTTFMEGILRSLVCARAINNPLTIGVRRADRSEKAVLGDVSDINGALITDKEVSPRLITWDSMEKARRSEILATFFPAVNNIRVKLGLEPLAAPVDRAALREAAQDDRKAAVKTLAEIEIEPVTTLSEEALSNKCFEILKALGYTTGDGSAVVDFFKAHAGVSKFSAMSRQQKENTVLALYQVIVERGREPS